MSQKDQLNRYISTMEVPKDLRQKLREYHMHYQNAAAMGLSNAPPNA